MKHLTNCLYTNTAQEPRHFGGYLALCRIIVLCLMFKVIFATQVFASDTPSSMLSITVRLESKPNLTRAKGIVFSSRSSLEIPEATISKIGDKMYEITFSAPRSKIHPDSVASAVAVDENGAPVYANVTPALLSEAATLLASVPECPGEDTSQALNTTTPGTIKQLVDVRTERMEIVRIKIKRAMDGNVLAKFAKFEEAFGLSRASELSADLPPDELFDRLSRIHHALRKYQAYKTKLTK